MFRKYLDSFFNLFSMNKKERLEQKIEDKLIESGFFDERYAIFHLGKQQWLSIFNVRSAGKDIPLWKDDLKLLDMNPYTTGLRFESTFELFIIDTLIKNNMFEGENYFDLLIVPLDEDKKPSFIKAIKLCDLDQILIDSLGF